MKVVTDENYATGKNRQLLSFRLLLQIANADFYLQQKMMPLVQQKKSGLRSKLIYLIMKNIPDLHMGLIKK